MQRLGFTIVVAVIIIGFIVAVSPPIVRVDFPLITTSTWQTQLYTTATSLDTEVLTSTLLSQSVTTVSEKAPVFEPAWHRFRSYYDQRHDRYYFYGEIVGTNHGVPGWVDVLLIGEKTDVEYPATYAVRRGWNSIIITIPPEGMSEVPREEKAFTYRILRQYSGEEETLRVEKTVYQIETFTLTFIQTSTSTIVHRTVYSTVEISYQGIWQRYPLESSILLIIVFLLVTIFFFWEGRRKVRVKVVRDLYR